jgi:hypothetical protein
MDKLVKDVLVGRTFRWWYGEKGSKYVILNVRKCFYFTYYLSQGKFYNQYNYYEMLVGRLSKDSRQISIMSWYRYDPNIAFIKRNGNVYSRRKCLKNHPNKYHYHVGERINLKRDTITVYKPVRVNGYVKEVPISFDDLMKLSEIQFV